MHNYNEIYELSNKEDNSKEAEFKIARTEGYRRNKEKKVTNFQSNPATKTIVTEKKHTIASEVPLMNH